MAKRSISGFRPKGLRIDEPFYSDADINHIIDVGGEPPEGKIEHRRPVADGMDFQTVTVHRREALQARLESAARAWDIEAQFQTEPTVKKMTQRHEQIARYAARMCEALGLPKGGSIDDVPDAIRYGPMLAAAEAEGGNLDEAVLAVQGILRWSLQAAEQGGGTDRQAPHEGDPALDGLFRRLIRIWVEIFEQKITTRETTPKDGPTRAAPTIRFIHAALRPLLKDATPSTESVRKRVQRIV